MFQAIQGKKSMGKPTISFYAIFNCKVYGVLIIISLVLLFSSVMSHNVLAQKPEIRKKTVTSVLIEPGDTLWSIASEFYTDEYESIPNYIKEIKKSNGLYTEEIHAGRYIIVPYYYEVE